MQPTPRSARPARARRVLAVLTAAAALVLGFVVGSTAGPAQAASTVTYIGTQTIPIPPASVYAGGGGGDGWAIALSDTEVFNVFHHQGSLTVACHLQADASQCYNPVTVVDGGGHNFGSSGHPGMYLDKAAGKLYVFATRDDATGGVVCFDTAAADAAQDPFCGFTALTAVGGADFNGLSSLSQQLTVGSRLFAFNYVSGSGVGADANRMLCYDLSTGAACAGQPYAIGWASTTFNTGNFPEPAASLIGGKIVVSNSGDAGDELSCFDPATDTTCTGSWPIAAPSSYTSNFGAPFSLLSPSGATTGVCVNTGPIDCWDLTGASVSTPAGMASALTAADGWNDGGVVIGSRVYIANGNLNDVVECYNAATDASCVGFPKSMTGAGFIYTVNPDPARPSCLWVNADFGSAQIQNFDAFTGAGCGQGPIRVLASSFVVNAPECTPGSYSRLDIQAPARSTYTDGVIQFLDGDASQLPIPDQPIDAAGGVDLTGLNLNSAAGLPQFLVTLNGAGAPSAVTVQLTWTGVLDPTCTQPGTVVDDLTVDAGPDVTGPVGGTIALNGAASGTTLASTAWSLPAGTPCTIAAPGSQHTTVRCTTAGTYVATLKGTDASTSVTDTTTITVTNPTAKQCNGKAATIIGTPGRDDIVGTPGDDVIVAGDGNDKIEGLGGDDVICAGDGDDKVDAGRGADFVNGGDGRDVLSGGSGGDAIVGRTGQDTIKGEGGNDDLNGNAGNDDLTGGAGRDSIKGNDGNDDLVGGAGSNDLIGGADTDTCGAKSDGRDSLFQCEVDNT